MWFCLLGVWYAHGVDGIVLLWDLLCSMGGSVYIVWCICEVVCMV